MKIDVITMGCSKNLVDSERLLFLFRERGHEVFHNPDTTHGEVAIINTCGFIGDAKEESIQMILDLCALKEDGLLQQLYVMGCLSERYLKELQKEIPEVDGFYGKFDWTRLLDDLEAKEDAQCTMHNAQTAPIHSSLLTPHSSLNTSGRVITTPSHYAYLKISEGCDRRCAYCAIPIITGRHMSRPMEEILDEVRTLVAQGVKEFQVIAQELTYYGLDLYGERRIAELVDTISRIEGVEWVRLHYAYPANFPTELLKVMRERPNVCKYMDIALQHISDHMLESMHRHITKSQTLQLIQQMREEVPGIVLRTTLMVGFPGETEEDFQELLEFVRTVRFDRLGAFAYSEEEGTYAAEHYEDNVPDEVKQARLSQIMAVQEQISAALMVEKVGQTFRVIIDRKEGAYYIGRTEGDSPEVDCEVLIKESEQLLEIGQFYNVRITSTEEFDMYGEVVDFS